MSGRFRPVCAEVMQRDAILADRMWSAVVGLTQDEPADLELKAEARVLLQCLFSRLISIFPQCGRMVFPGLVIMQSVM